MCVYVCVYVCDGEGRRLSVGRSERMVSYGMLWCVSVFRSLSKGTYSRQTDKQINKDRQGYVADIFMRIDNEILKQ